MKNIILTGTSSGFGRLTAQILAKKGHRVFATMRNIKGSNFESVQILKHWALDNNAKIVVVELDVTKESSVKKAVTEIARQCDNKIDVLINNAGSGFIGLNETLSSEQANDMFQVNVIAVDRMIKAVLPYMHYRKKGLLVTLSSVVSRMPIPVMGTYSATKAAVDALSVSYFYELRETGIDMAIIQPGLYPSTEILIKQPKARHPSAGLNYKANMTAFQKSLLNQFIPHENSPDPLEVAEVIAQVVNTPVGERELWNVVGAGPLSKLAAGINNSTREMIERTICLAATNIQSSDADGDNNQMINQAVI